MPLRKQVSLSPFDVLQALSYRQKLLEDLTAHKLLLLNLETR